MKKNTKTKISICFCLIVVLALASVISAKVTIESCYVISTDNKKIPLRNCYEIASVVSRIVGYEGDGSNIETLNSPEDLFIDKMDNIYIADTKNNSIIKLDKDFKFIKSYKGANGVDFNSPSGVYVDVDNNLFIGDSANGRVVVFDQNGVFKREFIKPVSEMLYDVHTFAPSKLVMNSSLGELYLIEGNNFLSLDNANIFKGYVGSSNIGFNFMEFLARTFSNADIQRQMNKREPPAIYNVTVAPNGFIYAIGGGFSDQIKRINSVGTNTYASGSYGEVIYDNNQVFPPNFVDIAVNSENSVAVADNKSSKIYQYDNDGNLLAVFGGRGQVSGRFMNIKSINFDSKGRLLVLDGTLNNIQIFEPTTFISDIQRACNLYSEGKYSESLKLWEEIAKISSNYPMANKSIAKIMYKNGQYEKSMEYYLQINDKKGYGTAYYKLRYTLMQKYFLLISLLALTLLISFIVFLLKLKKIALKFEEWEYFGKGAKK